MIRGLFVSPAILWFFRSHVKDGGLAGISGSEATGSAGILCKQCDELRDVCLAGFEGAGLRDASQRGDDQKTAS